MRGIARLNDKTIGTCALHGPGISGTIITASSKYYANGRQVARQGDKVKASCGHTAEIITYASRHNVDSRDGTARLNDKVGNSPYVGRIITASGNTNESD